MKYYGIKKNFLAIEEAVSNYDFSKVVILPDFSKVVILPVPYEATTSYGKGTGKGPMGILNASHYVELFDEELNRELCNEIGICTLKELNMKDKKGKKALDFIYKNVKSQIDAGKFVITLGGEHSISTAPIKAHFDSYENLSILHFDAHSDYRQEYEGSVYSHASFAARVAEFTKDIVQVGIRAQCKEEYDFIKSNNLKTFYAYEIRNGKYGYDWDKKVIDALNENVYITFDVDYFDPSVMPSTGTPEPLGFYWEETLNAWVLLGRNIKTS